MATAVSNSFSVVVASAAGVPAWYTALTANQWSTLPNSTLSSSGQGWTGTSPGGTSSPGYYAIWNAWSSGILNTTGVTRPGGTFAAGAHLCVFGGGHNDYGGNEVYAWGSFLDSSPQWRRLTDPTIPGPGPAARAGTKPSSRHTYDTLQHITDGGINKMLVYGCGFNYPNASLYNTVDLFNFGTSGSPLDPSSSDPWAAGPDITGGGAFGAALAATAVDSSDGNVYWIGGTNNGRFHKYDPSTNVMQTWDKNNPTYSNIKGSIDPRFHIMVWNGGNHVDSPAALYAFDCRDPANNSRYAPATTGTAPTGYWWGEWDPINNRFVCWSSGKTLYFLTPSSNPYQGGTPWAWSSFTPPSGSTPSAGNGTGTYGRFRYVPGPTQGYLLSNAADQPIYFYKF